MIRSFERSTFEGESTMKQAVKLTKTDQIQGEPDAACTLLEYGDYQCPSCSQVVPVIKKLQKHYGKRLQFVFRNFPLEQHEFAEAAAETAEFAAEHGKFWEMHDLLYKRQDEFSEDLFPELAEQLGLDAGELSKALVAGKYAAKVKADLASGEKAGVRGTPSFYIDGEQVEDSYDYESLVAAIDEKLK
jgi:protein-disulfide isomerase